MFEFLRFCFFTIGLTHRSGLSNFVSIIFPDRATAPIVFEFFAVLSLPIEPDLTNKSILFLYGSVVISSKVEVKVGISHFFSGETDIHHGIGKIAMTVHLR